ncbi:MAG TPA: FGGY-family carbohydrate kinase [Lichenihabitans sp.]|jgi:L-xylulokinase|nr:FGGY-family carbohydrate kinase [Lichenihabitans sp.]
MLLGLDCGSTAIKAVVFSLEGTAIATGSRRTEPMQPAPYCVEHDMDCLWRLACDAIADALAAAPPGAGTLDAIGVTAHGDGLYLGDAAARPLGRGIQSVDSRAHQVTAAWEACGTLDRVEAITAQRPYPYAASTLLAWISRKQPERYAAIRHVLFCKDWLRYRLTGVIATDPTDASTAFTDARTQRYSDALLSLLGLEAVRPALPPILPSSGVIGTISAAAAAETGLLQGTPVAGGMHDVTASAVGLGNLRPGVLSITAGTFSINETLSDHLLADRRWTARAGLRPGQWMNMSISPASSNNVDWFLRQAYRAEWDAATRGGPPVWDKVEADLAVPMAGDAPLFHPFLYGSPDGMPASAAFLGLRSWHERADMLRAVVEGAVFNHRFHVDALRSAFPVSRARITGGGTSRARPAQLFADALGLPVDVPEATEVGALGAALVAGVGVGVYASLDDAVQRACRVAARYEPDAARHAALSERFALYTALAEAIRPLSSGQAAITRMLDPSSPAA